jgi:hypothetical protein
LLTPTIRTIAEFELFKAHLASHKDYAHFVHSVWLEVTTPYLFDQILTRKITAQGIVINAPLLYQHAIGVSGHTGELVQHYPLDISYCIDQLRKLKSAYQHIPLYVRLNHIHPRLTDALSSLSIDGMIVPAQESTAARIRLSI